MAFTATEKELYNFCNTNDFLSAEALQSFSQRLDQEGNLASLNYALKDFLAGACPKCKAEGAFKWHFLGKLTHPTCESWYVPTGIYAGRQFKAVFRTGAEIGGSMASDAEKKGEKGYAETFFGFIIGASIRLPFAVMMIPVQAIVSLSQKKN